MQKCFNNQGRAIKLGENLINILNLIIESEKERGRQITSYREAGEILARRIEWAGGLKNTQEVTPRNSS